MNLCINCVFHQEGTARYPGSPLRFRVHHCGRTGKDSPVTGMRGGMRECASERGRSLIGRDRCGLEGRYFQPKESA